MVKFVAILTVSAALAGAQAPAPTKPSDPLAPLREAAQKKSSDWEALARGMEPKIGRMLPCDPRVRTSIEEVSRASQARLAAVEQFLNAAVAMATQEANAAKSAAGAPDEGNKDLQIEQAEAEQERIAVESQIADLGESVRRRAALEAAQKKLAEIAAMIRERAQQSEQMAEAKNTLAAPMKNLLAAYEARQAALQNEQAALAVEVKRWSDYYAARLARAQTECAIINQPGRKKP